MKKFLPVLVFCLIFFSSCSDAGDVTYTGAGVDTLKTVIKTKEEAVTWTQELESDRLTKNINQIDSVASGIKLFPDILKVSSVQSEPVYPRLRDFGFLDISELPEDIYQISKNFCDSLSSDLYSVQAFFAPTSFFSYVFFLNDLEKLFFKNGLPESPEQSESAESSESSESKKVIVFDKYLIGRPFGTDDEFQIPIRFYKSSDFVDVVIFISHSTNKISQIKIDRVGKISS